MRNIIKNFSCIDWKIEEKTDFPHRIVTACDENFEIGAAILIRSVNVFHNCKIDVYHLGSPSWEFQRLCYGCNADIILDKPDFEYRGRGWQTFGKPGYVRKSLIREERLMWLDSDCIVCNYLDDVCFPLWTDHGYHVPTHETSWPGEQSPNAGVFAVSKDDMDFISIWKDACDAAADNEPNALPYQDQGILDKLLPKDTQLVDGRIWTDFHNFRSGNSDPNRFIRSVFNRDSTVVHLGDRSRPWQKWEW